MIDIEQRIREEAYRRWEQAGRPEGDSEAFWYAARQSIAGDAPAQDRAEDAMLSPAEEPPHVTALHGVPAGMPGERIAEQGVLDSDLGALALPATRRPG